MEQFDIPARVIQLAEQSVSKYIGFTSTISRYTGHLMRSRVIRGNVDTMNFEIITNIMTDAIWFANDIMIC